MPFYVLKGDLVTMNVDAIVNASNVNLKMVEGVGRAIFHKAGDKELAAACKQIGTCNVGDAVKTPSFNLSNCKIIIHAVAPIYMNGKHGEEKLLISAYKKCFQILDEENLHSIAFPLLSGEFNYPLKDAYQVAFKVIMEYLKTHPENNIYLVMYKNFPTTVDDDLQEKLTKFITSTYSSKLEHKDLTIAKDNLEFVETVRKYQDETKTSDEKLISDGNLSRKLFQELVTNPAFIPSKTVCLAFAIAMKLDKNNTIKLLQSCGYNLVESNLLDSIVNFYIDQKNYDIYKINNSLFSYSLGPLGAYGY